MEGSKERYMKGYQGASPTPRFPPPSVAWMKVGRDSSISLCGDCAEVNATWRVQGEGQAWGDVVKPKAQDWD